VFCRFIANVLNLSKKLKPALEKIMTENIEQKKEYRAPEMKIVALEPCNCLSQASLPTEIDVVVEP
jgi:hypothetical protein